MNKDIQEITSETVEDMGLEEVVEEEAETTIKFGSHVFTLYF